MRALIVAMVDQAPAQRLVSLLDLLLTLATDRKASLLSSAANHLASPSLVSEGSIERVISYLHQHYRESTAIAKLMRMGAVSRSSLHRLFKLQTGVSIGKYVTCLRVGNACALLMNSQKPIAVIAADVGYANLANFNRQFKALKGKTPKEFRAAFSL